MGILSLVILCVLTFCGGFIDSISGGGGLITLPSYMFFGVPPINALACNKFSSTMGTTVSFIRMIRQVKINLKVGICAAITAFISSNIAARIVTKVDEGFLSLILIFVLPIIAFFIISKKTFSEEDMSYKLSKLKKYILSLLIGGIIGFYDGFFGPGTGTFAIIAFNSILKYDLKRSLVSAKLLNLASNYSAIIYFILSGKVLFYVAIPAACTGILGNYIGSALAIKDGEKIIKPFMIFVIVLLFLKLFFENFYKYFNF